MIPKWPVFGQPRDDKDERDLDEELFGFRPRTPGHSPSPPPERATGAKEKCPPTLLQNIQTILFICFICFVAFPGIWLAVVHRLTTGTQDDDAWDRDGHKENEFSYGSENYGTYVDEWQWRIDRSYDVLDRYFNPGHYGTENYGTTGKELNE
jgi:hypothetical protein